MIFFDQKEAVESRGFLLETARMSSGPLPQQNLAAKGRNIRYFKKGGFCNIRIIENSSNIVTGTGTKGNSTRLWFCGLDWLVTSLL